MENNTVITFSFLTEILKENTYSLLYPDPKAGLAIICLYEGIRHGTFPQNSFKEKDIHDALSAVNPSIDNDKSRHPREHYNAIISNLLDYFLRYDEERQEYSLKEYAFVFCRQAHAILESNFSPTRIEKICFALHQKLEKCLEQQSLIDWFWLEFDAFKPQLKSQLDFLDRQIDQSVSALRENKKVSLQEGTIIETLKQIDERFEIIRTQNKELRSAFREIDQIRRLIEGYASQYDNSEIDQLVHVVVSFFQEMRRTLGIIDKRLDRIQPKIKQLFSNLNKPQFNAKIERFLYYLLENSKETNEGNKKSIQLPNAIPSLSFIQLSQNFTIVERKNNLFPIQAKKRMIIPESPEAKSKAFASFQQRINQQDQISYWVQSIQNDATKEQELNLSDYFFRIAQLDDPDSINLAIKVILRTATLFESAGKHRIEINPEVLIQRPKFKTSLWQIMIKRK